jgi:hypothetical protein
LPARQFFNGHPPLYFVKREKCSEIIWMGVSSFGKKVINKKKICGAMWSKVDIFSLL